MRAALALVAALLVGAGCTDLSQRWELDHARILAVRATPPGLGADEVALIDLLVIDDAGTPSVATPGLASTAEANPEPAVAAALTLSPTSAGWQATAGDADDLAAARAAAGLADDEPLDVLVGVTHSVPGAADPLLAIKAVRLGEADVNPATPTIRVDGLTVAEGDVATVERGREIELTFVEEFADPSEDEPLEFDWLTGTGSLTKSQTRRGLLEIGAEDPDAGYVVAIVRTATGGVSWSWIQLAVE
ncbi:MAG: hypothetical protein R2939_17680 [Kofleriaceae bacterium]